MSRNVSSGTVAARFIIYFFKRLMLWDDILSSEVVHTKYEDKVLNEKQFFINGFRKWFSTFDCSIIIITIRNHTWFTLYWSPTRMVFSSWFKCSFVHTNIRSICFTVGCVVIHGETNKQTNKHSFHNVGIDYIECSRPYQCYMLR